MKCVVMLGVMDTAIEEGDFLVGVDRGAFYLAKSGKMMDLAVGDFDSVIEEEFLLIQSHTKELYQIPKEKDVTDSEYAMQLLNKMDFQEIIILGGLGKRFDHSLVNIKLLEKYKNGILKDSYNKIYLLQDGIYIIKKEAYQYLSFVPKTKGVITVKGVKYPLIEKRITPMDTYLVSNEILDEEAVVEIVGSILVFQTND